MTFIWPPALLSVLLVPIGVWLYVAIGRRRRGRLVDAFGAAAKAGSAGVDGARSASAGTSPGGPGARQGRSRPRSARPAGPGLAGRAVRAVPPLLVIVGLVVVAVGLARPQAVVALPRQEGTVILAFDVSGSMAATDISPTRIAAARTAARDFVANQPATIDIGVVAFSDSGAAVQAPTNDQATVDAAIDRLAPQKGTSLASGISASLDAIAAAELGPYSNNYYSNQSPAPTATPTPTPYPSGQYSPAVIVLLTDGENNENPDPLTAAQRAADQGVRIFTVGLGSAAGIDLDVNGVHVHTQLNEAELQQISQMTGGSYFAATDAAQLRSVYDNLDTQLVSKPELTELTSLFAGAGALLLLAGGMASLLATGRLP